MCHVSYKKNLTYVKENKKLENRKGSTADNKVMRLLAEEEGKLPPETNGGKS